MSFRVLKNPKETFHKILQKLSWALPSELFLKLVYFIRIGRKLNLNDPKTFNEKIQWLKLHDHNPVYHTMVDKYAVKEYISDVLGSEYVIPLLGVWDKASDIEWDKLPCQFVIKATHSGGGGAVFICKDKNSFDKEEVGRRLQIILDKIDLYKRNKEWAYKGIPHRILAEKFVDVPNGQLDDYKFYCFNGKVKIIKVDFGRFVEHHANFYDSHYNLLPFGLAEYPPEYSHNVVFPDNIGEMVNLAEKLSNGFTFLRVDLYNVENKILFGETTFYPDGGFGHFIPEEWNNKLGEMLDIG